MKITLSDVRAVLTSIKYPKAVISALYGCSIENNAKKMRQNDILREVSLKDIIGENYPAVYPYSKPGYGSGITDLILLNGLAKKIPECQYLEIGTWMGESICNVAKFAKNCISVSLSERQVHQEYGKKHADLINYFCKKFNYENITLIGADSKDFDFNSLNQKFDLIFIDGDHSYLGIVNDTRKALDCMRDDRSVIVWHDYTFGAEKIRYNTLNAILDAVPADLQKYLYHVEGTMCAVLFIGNIKSKEYEEFPRKPKMTYEVIIKETVLPENCD